MKDIPIEEGIPIISPKRGGGGRKPLYPFNKLKVGDSFFISLDDWLEGREENGKYDIHRLQRSLWSAGDQYARRVSSQGEKFITRQVETPEKGVRAWRVV
jgi:hypothetical protein